jgi:hypothetical protein
MKNCANGGCAGIIDLLLLFTCVLLDESDELPKCGCGVTLLRSKWKNHMIKRIFKKFKIGGCAEK